MMICRVFAGGGRLLVLAAGLAVWTGGCGGGGGGAAPFPEGKARQDMILKQMADNEAAQKKAANKAPP